MSTKKELVDMLNKNYEDDDFLIHALWDSEYVRDVLESYDKPVPSKEVFDKVLETFEAMTMESSLDDVYLLVIEAYDEVMNSL